MSQNQLSLVLVLYRMIKHTTIDDFLQLTDAPLLVDVRTPAEFEQGHVPGAVNVPLFSNEERVLVGTTYKQSSREEAILLGFDLVGPKWSGFIKECLQLAPSKRVAVHCWRGGMRSGAMAWALDLYGFEVIVIRGGYKAYRQLGRSYFEKNYILCILGGMTGSGKTKLLHELKALEEQVIDLEDLAQHQGSSFGSMNQMQQPTQEQFENNLTTQLLSVDSGKMLWLEDESLKIGKCRIPHSLWLQMRSASLIDLQIPLEQRVAFLVQEYGSLDPDFLIDSTERIQKRLGPDQTKKAVAAIRENRMDDFIRIVLVYYDKTYRKGLSMRDQRQVFPLELEGADAASDCQALFTFAGKILPKTTIE
jgi:tRNA 2-selenouridine synthase